jgi:hypothetical protein
MKRLIVELPDEEYENIITLAAVNIGRGGRFPYKGIVMYALNAIRRAEIIDAEAADKEATTKIDLVVRQLREEADYAYADFDEYKAETLGADADELPDDVFRYGLERAIEVIKAADRSEHEKDEA